MPFRSKRRKLCLCYIAWFIVWWPRFLIFKPTFLLISPKNIWKTHIKFHRKSQKIWLIFWCQKQSGFEINWRMMLWIMLGTFNVFSRLVLVTSIGLYSPCYNMSSVDSKLLRWSFTDRNPPLLFFSHKIYIFVTTSYVSLP